LVKHVVKLELPKLRLWKKKADEAVEEGIEVDLKEKKINISGAVVIGAAFTVGVGVGFMVGKSRAIKKDSNVFIIK
jgi:long-subunit fatty acid transport protein